MNRVGVVAVALILVAGVAHGEPTRAYYEAMDKYDLLIELLYSCKLTTAADDLQELEMILDVAEKKQLTILRYKFRLAAIKRAAEWHFYDDRARRKAEFFKLTGEKYEDTEDCQQVFEGAIEMMQAMDRLKMFDRLEGGGVYW